MPVVYEFVCIRSDEDYVVWVKHAGPTIDDVGFSYWVEMMYSSVLEDLEPRKRKLTAVVSENDLASKTTPFIRLVEVLVYPSVVTKCFITD